MARAVPDELAFVRHPGNWHTVSEELLWEGEPRTANYKALEATDWEGGLIKCSGAITRSNEWRRAVRASIKNFPLVFAAASDALVHEEFDLGPAIFAAPRRALVGSRRVGLTHCAR